MANNYFYGTSFDFESALKDEAYVLAVYLETGFISLYNRDEKYGGIWEELPNDKSLEIANAVLSGNPVNTMGISRSVRNRTKSAQKSIRNGWKIWRYSDEDEMVDELAERASEGHLPLYLQGEKIADVSARYHWDIGYDNPMRKEMSALYEFLFAGHQATHMTGGIWDSPIFRMEEKGEWYYTTSDGFGGYAYIEEFVQAIANMLLCGQFEAAKAAVNVCADVIGGGRYSTSCHYVNPKKLLERIETVQKLGQEAYWNHAFQAGQTTPGSHWIVH